MKIEDVKRNESRVRKTPVNLRIDSKICKWMNFRKVSPTLLFETAATELMNLDKNWEKEHEAKKTTSK